MSDFVPPEGWAEVDEYFDIGSKEREVLRWDDGRLVRWFVRDKSKVQLPTEPGTVIEVMSTTRQEIDVTAWFLTPNQEWEPIGHYAASIEGGLRLTDITRYRTVSMPT